MYCYKCGSKLKKESIYCSKCGSKILEKEQKQEQSSNIEETHNVASQQKRFVNYLIDYLLVCQIIIPLFIFFLIDYVDESIAITLSLVLPFLYFLILEATTGKTLGKVITKTEVVDIDGIRPNIWRVLIRTLCRFIPFDAFSYLFKEPLGWHDKISKTYVIES